MAALPLMTYAPGEPIQDFYDKVNNTITAVNDATSQNEIATKVIELGFWDMDSTTCIDVAHGLTATQALTVGVLAISIIDDDQLKSNSLGTSKTLSCGGGDGYEYVDATEIRISRLTGGVYDSTNFNNGAINRGHIYISYIK